MIAAVIVIWVAVMLVLSYLLGRCDGWLSCSENHAKPALQGWRDSNEFNGELIEQMKALRSVANPKSATPTDQVTTAPMHFRIQEVELPSPHGHRTGCFRWVAAYDLCDHEHGEGEPMCEDARSEAASFRARNGGTNPKGDDG
jgi:hypothetical protein